MDWSYVAGLFDGEGSVSFQQHKGGSPQLHIRLVATTSREVEQALTSFLTREGIRFGVAHQRRDRPIVHIVTRLEDCERLARTLLPVVVAKKEHLEISLELIEFRKRIRAEGKLFSSQRDELNVYRRRLQSLAMKGREPSPD